MKITPKQEEKLQEFLGRQKLGKCACGNNSFTFVDKVYELRELPEGGFISSSDSSTLPVVMFVCKSCGEMKMLSAVILGIIDNEEKVTS